MGVRSSSPTSTPPPRTQPPKPNEAAEAEKKQDAGKTLRRGQIANKNLAIKNLRVVPNILPPQNSTHHERNASAPIFFVYPHPQNYHHPHHRHFPLGASRQTPVLLLRGWKSKGKFKRHGVGPPTHPLKSDSNDQLPRPPPSSHKLARPRLQIFFLRGG